MREKPGIDLSQIKRRKKNGEIRPHKRRKRYHKSSILEGDI